jgi:hypothetical protein
LAVGGGVGALGLLFCAKAGLRRRERKRAAVVLAMAAKRENFFMVQSKF